MYECNFNHSNNNSTRTATNYLLKLFTNLILGVFIYLCFSINYTYAQNTNNVEITTNDALSSLIKVLEDPDSRQKLIQQLNEISSESTNTSPDIDNTQNQDGNNAELDLNDAVNV